MSKRFVSYILIVLSVFASYSNTCLGGEETHDVFAHSIADKMSSKIKYIGDRIDIYSCDRSNWDSCEIEDLRINDVNHNSNNVEVHVSCGNIGVKVNCKYKVLSMFPVLKEDIKRGDVIGRNDVEMIEIEEPKNMRSNLLREKTDIVGMRANANIKANHFIMGYQLRKDLSIKKGQQLTAIYNNGNIVLKTKVIAMEKGGVGDYINVKNAKSGAIMSGVIDATRCVIIN